MAVMKTYLPPDAKHKLSCDSVLKRTTSHIAHKSSTLPFVKAQRWVHCDWIGIFADSMFHHCSKLAQTLLLTNYAREMLANVSTSLLVAAQTPLQNTSFA